MPFSYYKADAAPAPDWGAVVQARLGKQHNRQAALNALQQLAEENQKIRVHREDEANDNRMRAFQLDEAQRHNITIESQGQEGLDLEERKIEDTMTMRDADREAAATSRTVSTVAAYLRAAQQEHGRNQRAAAENQMRLEIEQHKREEALQKLQQAKKRSESMQQAMSALAVAPKNFTPHEFTAAELAPFYSADPARMVKSIRGSKAAAGSEETAEDIYQNMLKAKVTIPVAPEGWFAQTIKPFAGDLAPQDMEALAKYAHGEDLIPYASSPGEARSRAHDYFKGHTSLGRLFASDQAPPPKVTETPGEKFMSAVDKQTYKANAENISLFKMAKELTPGQQAALKALEEENDAIVKKHTGGAEVPAAQDPLLKELDDLLGPEQPK